MDGIKMSIMEDYLDGKKHMLMQAAWRLKGMHDIEKILSDEAFNEIVDWIKKRALEIDGEGINFDLKVDAQSRISNIFDDEVDE